MPVRAVVFDLFDTLVDLRFEDLERIEHEGKQLPASMKRLHEQLSAHATLDFGDFLGVLREVDTGMRATQVEEGRETSTRERFDHVTRKLGVDVPGLSDDLTEIHMATLQGLVAVPAHHTGVLAQLGERFRLGLCSNFTHAPTAHDVLREAGFDTQLDATIVSETVGWRKPRKEIFRAVLDALEVAPEDVLHVGDSLRADISGAAPMGMRTAWITRRVRDPAAALRDHDGPPPDHQIADLADLLEILS